MRVPIPVEEFPNSEWCSKIKRLLDQRTSVNSETGCWEFGSHNGYGQITIDHEFYYVHRLSAKMYLGYSPEQTHLWVLHRCSSRNCWNPEHLYIGTASDNAQDRTREGTARNQNMFKTHCPKGHEYSEENTNQYQSATGVTRRYCKECQRIKMKNYYDKKKVVKIDQVG